MLFVAYHHLNYSYYGGLSMRFHLGLVILSFIFLMISICGCYSTPTPVAAAAQAVSQPIRQAPPQPMPPQIMPTDQSTANKHSARLVTGEFDNAHIPPYIEYEPISLVFTTTEEYENIDSPFMTYLSLLRKAHELGGHAIVNVSIEENKSCVKTVRPVGPYDKGDVVCQYRRFGAALAVKYTKPITGSINPFSN